MTPSRPPSPGPYAGCRRLAATSANHRDSGMSFEYLPKLWPTRLAVMRDVFPWVNESIKEIGGLAADDNLASSESQVAFLQAHDEYRQGGRSTCPEIVAIHQRHNLEWETLTGIGPLGTLDDWRAAGHAAGAPADAIQGCDIDKLARFIVPWAIARRVATEAADAKDETPIDFVTLLQCAAMVNKSKRTLERWKENDPAFPSPEVIGDNGRADEWRWATIRTYLETKGNRRLPQTFPAHVAR